MKKKIEPFSKEEKETIEKIIQKENEIGLLFIELQHRSKSISTKELAKRFGSSLSSMYLLSRDNSKFWIKKLNEEEK